ncbi:uncharacterized protein LOC129729445 isoform X2 [Wyeomyia smithii]|nr:uncharacterized protein LOC129729445 isoform X2 [Wyeomyia smithii]
MYIDVDLWSRQKESQFSAVWLAATNKTLFRRYFKRNHCENIAIDDLCQSILDYMKINKPLVIVARLAYGLTYIYQQQVNFLYNRVSAAYSQSIALHNMKKEKFVSVSQRYDKHTALDFVDIDEEPLLPMEKIIAELVTSKNGSTVLHEEDITLRDSVAVPSTVTNELEFEEMHFTNDEDVLEVALENWNFIETRNDSYLAEKTCSAMELPPDNCTRQMLVPHEKEMESPSLAILEMPIASTYDSHSTNDNQHTGNYLPVNEELSDVSSSMSNYSQHRSLIEKNSSQIIDSVLSVRKRKGAKHLIMDKRTKLAADVMRHAIEHSANTLRCQDPRSDILPIHIIRYPLDIVSAIFKHPARSTRSSFLKHLFQRNARKRAADNEDLLMDECFDRTQIMRKENDGNDPSSKLRKVENLSKTPTLPLGHIHPVYSGAQQTENVNLQWNIESNRPKRHIFDSTNIRETVDEFCEERLLKFLENLWSSNPNSILFTSLEAYFFNKLDAVRCFSAILVLVAKQKLEISRTVDNQISDIKKGPAF